MAVTDFDVSNDTDRYGAVAKFFHWSIALGIFANLALGFIAAFVPTDTSGQVALKTSLFSTHKTLGIVIFALALARILWALSQPKPAPLHPERRAETLAAATVHWLLYGSLVLVPLSGWIGHAASEGFAPIWWPLGQGLPLVPKSTALAETAWAVHFVFMWVLVASVALHVAGALKHHVVDRDATLRRMWPGGTRAGHPATAHQPHALPAVLAVALWAVALGIGSMAGLFRQDAQAAEPAALDEVASDWVVQDGELAIAVIQMGDEVSGAFSDWTADIDYEPRDTPGPAGSVTVRINLGSLALGSVTDQATNPAYLAAEEYPTATFEANLVRTDDGHVAEGTLTLKGETVPVTLPFDLTLSDDTAEMSGATTLDRRNYGIGQSMEDESQVGFDVEVRVALTAERSEGGSAD
ncbi:hypothetical protein ROJ8625_01342 [Roseivivax jejudonensis]|uniref:Lipid/polyisoprenoid-binding YceI-like domain-containing protein n=1 Tax=Roseivivax jejudonensis TaxID=1529041 RepID=A0A1X6YSK8_9RHOB|nr:cytochrome b/b6 domain-containing protein [Roseivivax jejudonensis]SLN29994.1 hypothetical protein ROJ8625_01342 [Roseivivax jejudonensis]